MERRALLAATVALSACGGSAAPDENAPIRARWADNIAQTAPLRAAIEQCAKANQGTLTATCDAIATLIHNGFLPNGYSVNATENMTSATVTSATAAIVMTGTAPANNCVVSITPSVTAGPTVTWIYLNGGGCSRLHTGVGT